MLPRLLFNIYVNDLTDVLPTEVNCHQYANDITIYSHCKPSELQRVAGRRCRLFTWSFLCNLALHPKKTKVMLLSTPQMSQTHGLDGHCIHLCANGKTLQRLLTFRLPWYGSARKRQLEKSDKLHDLKLLRNFDCTEEAEIPCPLNYIMSENT